MFRNKNLIKMTKGKDIKNFNLYKILGLVLSLVLLYFGYVVISNENFKGFENIIRDKVATKSVASKNIVLIVIDDYSLQKIGVWPIDRGVYSKLLENLNQYPPKVLGIDIIFPEKSNNKESDLQLINSINKANYNIVLAKSAKEINFKDGYFNSTQILPSIISIQEQLEYKKDFAFVNLITDNDGILRTYPSYIDDQKTFSARVLELYNDYQGELNNGENNIIFSDKNTSFEKISLYDLLNIDSQKLKRLEGKIVLLGATAPSLQDSLPTPQENGSEMPGVEVHANIINQNLNGDRLLNSSFNQSIFALLIVVVLINILFLTNLKVIYKNLFSVLLILITFIVLIWFNISGVLFPIFKVFLFSFLTYLSWIFFISLEKERNERVVKNIFKKYVSPQVMSELIKNKKSLELGGVERDVTLFFADIRNFTTISESHNPKVLFEFLNRYLTLVTDVIIKNEGVLDKYIGDGVMAFWGAPLHNKKHTDLAIDSALEILERLKIFNQQQKERGLPEFRIGIGINTGKAIVGNVGSRLRQDYTVIGDTVNTASRIEGVTKDFSCQLLISEESKISIIDQERYNFKYEGDVTLKGKEKKVKLYSVSYK